MQREYFERPGTAIIVIQSRESLWQLSSSFKLGAGAWGSNDLTDIFLCTLINYTLLHLCIFLFWLNLGFLQIGYHYTGSFQQSLCINIRFYLRLHTMENFSIKVGFLQAIAECFDTKQLAYNGSRRTL